ncbi:hypothetical protein IWQ56_002154 [Coemansia nantahalensis]|nr:hypothetical protein IWQ56_002154 [Coemansia nantahalensis]
MTAEPPTSPVSPVSPVSPSGARSSLGLHSGIGSLGGGISTRTVSSAAKAENARLSRTRSVTEARAAAGAAAPAGSGERRHRGTRRQSEDVMRTMRSLDRQYGRRRRLNTDQPATGGGGGGGDASGSTKGGSGDALPALRRGDSRALFAPLVLPQAEAVVVEGRKTPSAQSAAPEPSRLAQLMVAAGRLVRPQDRGGVRSQDRGVRPRASMPLINGMHRPPQRTRSQVAHKPRDELTGALTMKSVEIRGGRIMLDDPSSSEASDSEDGGGSSDGDGDGGTDMAAAAPLRREPGLRGSGCAVRSSIASSVYSGMGDPYEWEDALRQRWYARRCLGQRQPFASVHRLARAEHDSGQPFPLLNDLRQVLDERACELAGAADGNDCVGVLLCTDAIVVCAGGPGGSRQPLRAVEFGERLDVRVDGDAAAVVVASPEDGGGPMQLQFPAGGACEWAELACAAQARFVSELQDLRLDEEDYLDCPPAPLLHRGRSSIAGANTVSAAGALPRLRNNAQGGVYWVPDAETSVCMVCRKTTFSMMVRRHHCRACGLVICYRCSDVRDPGHRRLCLRCSAAYRPHTVRSKPSSLALAPPVSVSDSLPPPLPAAAPAVAGQADAATAEPTVDTPPAALRRKPDRHARRPLSSLFAPKPSQSS